MYVYLKITEVHIELYTDCKDLSAEQKVEAVLDEHGIFYEKTEEGKRISGKAYL